MMLVLDVEDIQKSDRIEAYKLCWLSNVRVQEWQNAQMS